MGKDKEKLVKPKVRVERLAWIRGVRPAEWVLGLGPAIGAELGTSLVGHCANSVAYRCLQPQCFR